jgi:eukaryotic-like serine/threonine-protein kinase
VPTGSVLDRYRYIKRLGAGGSSTVHLAEDTLLGRQVALKRIHTPDDVSARSRLRREALIGASVSHPNLISIYDIVTTDEGEDVIVMEYLEGETLADRLRGGRKPEVGEALGILDGVASALGAIHAERVVHRDVKPSNILLGIDGSVKLADLGIAAALNRTQITTAGAVMGTFSYMAPEQLEGADATPAVDVYALAAVAYEVLGGERARQEDNPLALAHAIATQPPPDLRRVWPQAPAAAAEVLATGMSREPATRPQTARELIARLRTALDPRPTEAVAARPLSGAPWSAAPRRRPSRGGPLAVAATLLAAGTIAAVVLADTGGSGQRVASHSAHRTTPAHARSQPSSHTTTSSQTTTTNAAAAASTPAGSPVNAVEAFYHLAAAHRYPAAMALADPAFRDELQGLQGLQATMAPERSIIFNDATVTNQSPSSAMVAVRTTSIRDNGTQNCSGTVALVRAGTGSPSWLLDHIQINCV